MNLGRGFQAIEQKRLLEFTYDGYLRVAEPHVYGIKNEKYQLLTYQVRGQSSKPEDLPEWRRFDLDQILGMRILDDHFPGPRDYSAWRDPHFDVVLAVVK